MFHISLSTCILFLLVRIPTVQSAPPLLSREPVSAGKGANTTLLNATVLDRAGHDITSAFQLRVYYPEYHSTSSTNNSLSNRQVSYSRSIHTCTIGGIFMESFCTPQDNKTGSLQSYTVVCHHIAPAPDPEDFPDALLGDYAPISFIPNQQIVSRRRDGHCAEGEICVPGIGAGKSRSGRRMASCVRSEYFIKYINWGDNHEGGMALEGMAASLVASQLDGKTPFEVDSFEVDTETTADSSGQKKKCRDCVELETDKFEATTEGLKIQTTLLTTGAMAGVLWLAIMSG